jgi:hypothetical protein
MVLDGLRRELDVPIGRPLATMAPVPPERAAEAWLALAQIPGQTLALAAARLWTRWFGRDLAPLRPETDSP